MKGIAKLASLEAKVRDLPRERARGPVFSDAAIEAATFRLFADWPDLWAWLATRKGSRPDPHLIEALICQGMPEPVNGLWDLRLLARPDIHPHLYALALETAAAGLIASRWAPGRDPARLYDWSGRLLAELAGQIARWLRADQDMAPGAWPHVNRLGPCPDCGPGCPAPFSIEDRVNEAAASGLAWRQSLALVGADPTDFDRAQAIRAAFWADDGPSSRRAEYRELLQGVDPGAVAGFDAAYTEARPRWQAGQFYHPWQRVWMDGPPEVGRR